MFDHPHQGKSETRRQHLSAAFEIATDLMEGKQSLESLAGDLSGRGKRCLDARLRSLSNQWTTIARSDNEGRLAAIIRGFADDGDGGVVPFAEFSGKLEDELAGLVITAHPTFSLSDSAWTYARAYLGAVASGADAVSAATENLDVGTVHPTRSPTLHEELEYARIAVGNIRRAIRRFHTITFNEAAKLYPDE